MRLNRDYINRVYAGWLGKVMGVRHGAPVEGWSSADIERIFGDLDGYCLDVDVFEPDDDINGPLFFLRALEDARAGRDITTAQMARAWTNYAPYEHGFFWWPGYGKPTNYHLLEQGDEALAVSGKPNDGLGPRIFIDTWGLAAPGDLPLAAKLARTAVRVSAVPGGAAEDAAVLQTCMIAAAFVRHSPLEVLNDAITELPPDGDIARMACDVRTAWEKHPDDWKATRAHIDAHWAAPRFPGMFHAVSNTAYILLGLLHSDDSLRRGLSICTQCGLDTDCNSGNLGAILGVLLGLKGIDKSMRRSMNDVAICSSVLGEQNIGDIPTQAKYIALQGFRLAGEPAPVWLSRAIEKPLCLDFSLPGNTHGLRIQSDTDAALRPAREDEEAGVFVWSRAHYARTGMRVFHRTYYRPADVHNNRYDPCFSPKVYPGETLRAQVRADTLENLPLVAALFTWDDNAQSYIEGPGIPLRGNEWTELNWRIPPATGACLTQVGVRFTLTEARDGGFSVRMRLLEADGSPEYTMDFSRERMEIWSFVQHELSQFTYSRGQWAYHGARLHGLVARHGEVFTGARGWRDYAVSCTLIPETDRGARLLARAQGAFRYYAAALEPGGAALLRVDRETQRLAFAPLPWKTGEPVRLRIEVQEIKLRVYCDGALLIETSDDAFDSGCVGLGLSGECSQASFETLSVEPLDLGQRV